MIAYYLIKVLNAIADLIYPYPILNMRFRRVPPQEPTEESNNQDLKDS